VTRAAPIRVGIVGCGDVARRFHAPAFAAQPDVSIVGCTSRSSASADRLAACYGASSHTTLEALISAQQPNLLVITTHESARIEPLELGLRAGCNLFVEKPLFASVDQDRITVEDYLETRRVLEGWDRSRTTLGVNFNYRTMPHMKRMEADIADGSLGEIKMVAAVVHLACWSHTIDLLQSWLGRIESVSALRRNDGENLDRVCVASFPNGVIGTLAAMAGTMSRASLLHIEVRGSRARGVAEGINGSYSRYDEAGEASVQLWPNPDAFGDYYTGSFRSSIDAYCAALRAGSPPPVSGDDGLAEMAVEAALDLSVRSAGAVAVSAI
jgi:myo-inositol 2-dehydrogenase / D-chiro-inositol 1-dehydrogenase